MSSAEMAGPADLEANTQGGSGHPVRRRASPWLAFVARRLVRFFMSLCILVVGAFWVIHLVPGDPVRSALGLKASPQLVRMTRHQLGLDDPILVQLGHYLQGVVSGDLGQSMVSRIPVSETLVRLLPNTASLVLAAFTVTILVSIPVGMWIGVVTRENRRRKTYMSFAAWSGFFGVIPEFLLAVGLVFIFAVTFRIFPVAGLEGPGSYVLPVLALAAGPTSLLARISRVETQRVLGEEYIRVARAKRLPARVLYLRHALPNTLTASLTVGGLILSSLLASTVLVEKIFAWPGLGSLLVSSVLSKDYPVVEALVLVFGGAALLINLTVDIAISVIDRRSTIREG